MKNNKNIWIIGLGLFGNEIIKKIIENDCFPSIVDKNEKKLTIFKNTESNLFVCDTKNKNEIKELGIEENAIILITLGQHFQSSIITCQNFLELGYENLYVQTIDDSHEKILRLIGITNIIRPYKILSDFLFEKIFLKYKLISKNENYSIIETINSKDWNKPLNEFNLREKYNINILLIERNKKIVIPKKKEKILKNDVITFLVPKDKIELSKKIFN